jgi:hypothetical protein
MWVSGSVAQHDSLDAQRWEVPKPDTIIDENAVAWKKSTLEGWYRSLTPEKKRDWKAPSKKTARRR